MRVFSKQLLMKKPAVVFENSNAGSYQVVLPAGRYEITLIGGGGGGFSYRSGVTNTHHYGQGGVGATLQVIVNNYVQNNITVNVGGGGVSISGTFGGGAETNTAGSGTQSSITGIPGAELRANDGTGAQFTPTSSFSGTRTPGVMGTNTATGDTVVEIKINNPNNIISNAASSSSTSRTPKGAKNSNWPAETTRGQGGDGGWRNTAVIKMNGSDGYVRIRRV